MRKSRAADDVVARWMAIPRLLRNLVEGLSQARLDARADSQSMSVRQTVHHIVEANLIASNIIIAALARPGSPFDWTWVTPGGPWMQRLGYHKAPLEPALATIDALTRHVAALLSVIPAGLKRTVQLWDSPGAPRYTKTVRQILADEVGHAREHVGAVASKKRG